MNREAQALLDKIEQKKASIKALAAAGKYAEVKAAKGELQEMQDAFDAIKDMDDEAEGAASGAVRNGTAKKVNREPTMKDKIKAFVGVLTSRLQHKAADAEDVRIYDAMSAGSDEDGGLTIPPDIQTQIVELRRTQDDLEQYTNVEPVNTNNGSRVIEKDADATPWDEVDEAAKFGDAATPKFKKITYKITKKGGIMRLTRELLQDTAENIMGYLRKYIAKKSRATRNAYILKLIKDEKDKPGETVNISTIDDLKKIFNVTLDPAVATSAMVFTNQSGYNYLDTLKDADGNYILQPDPTKKTEKYLFGAYRVIPMMNKTWKSVPVEGGMKYPVICGDLKEAVTLFDREKLSIEMSDQAGDLWERDQTGVKVRDRFDLQMVDAAAVVYGYITEATNG